MDFVNSKIESLCPREDIGLYLDGELSPNDEILLEKHIAGCDICKEELNLQKQMLSALNFAFEQKNEVELPRDFTKIIVTKAESGVKGLRCKDERSKALFLSLILLLMIAVGFSGENVKIYSILSSIGNQIATLSGFVFHFAYDISFGIAVILRNLCQKVVINSIFILLSISFLSLISIFFITRIFQKLARLKASL